ncbi:hypothetical protein [Paraburkholderia youngii]|nr:hypothetical protein [Paraburkholderia youngii]
MNNDLTQRLQRLDTCAVPEALDRLGITDTVPDNWIVVLDNF